jgi:hypothetical protein
MAKLTVQEVLEKKYLTDATLAEKLLLPEGTAGRLTLDDDIIKAHIHQVGAYIEVYGDQEERDSHDDGDSSNDIVFTLDGEEMTYTGKPTVAASTALKSLDITGTLYVGSEEFVTKGLKATDLAGLDLLTEPAPVPVEDEIYDFVSYADAEATTEWGRGTVKVTDRTEDETEVEVLTNEPEAEFVGQKFVVKAVELDPDAVLELYKDGEATGIYVKVSAHVEAEAPAENPDAE